MHLLTSVERQNWNRYTSIQTSHPNLGCRVYYTIMFHALFYNYKIINIVLNKIFKYKKTWLIPIKLYSCRCVMELIGRDTSYFQVKQIIHKMGFGFPIGWPTLLLTINLACVCVCILIDICNNLDLDHKMGNIKYNSTWWVCRLNNSVMANHFWFSYYLFIHTTTTPHSFVFIFNIK